MKHSFILLSTFILSFSLFSCTFYDEESDHNLSNSIGVELTEEDNENREKIKEEIKKENVHLNSEIMSEDVVIDEVDESEME